MSTNETAYSKLVHDTLLELASTVCCADRRLNERHLHHWFSYVMQSHGLSLGLRDSEPILHPEWPTYKERTCIAYARYKRHDLQQTREYRVDDRGVAGYLDFAIGPYEAPLVGVEMTLKRGWAHEEIVFDLMKLLHPSMPFAFAASLNVLLAPDRPVFRGLRSGQVLIPAAFETAMRRLRSAGRGGGVRRLLALFVEVPGSGDRCVWRLTGDGQAQKMPLATLMASEWTVTVDLCRGEQDLTLSSIETGRARMG